MDGNAMLIAEIGEFAADPFVISLAFFRPPRLVRIRSIILIVFFEEVGTETIICLVQADSRNRGDRNEQVPAVSSRHRAGVADLELSPLVGPRDR